MTERSDVANVDAEPVTMEPVTMEPVATELVTAEPGGLTSFDAFFTEHHTELVRALTLALGDVELGRDAASEGFVRALQRWNRVATYDNAPGWIYRVGLNWARSRRRKTVREVSAHPTERSFAASEPDLALARALRSLSLDHRAVVVARYYLDWSEADVAAVLKIAPGTAKSRLSRALDRLHADLGDSTLILPSTADQAGGSKPAGRADRDGDL